MIYFWEPRCWPLANLMVLGAVAVCFAGGLGVSVLGPLPRPGRFLGGIQAARAVCAVGGAWNEPLPLAAVPLDSVHLAGMAHPAPIPC